MGQVFPEKISVFGGNGRGVILWHGCWIIAIKFNQLVAMFKNYLIVAARNIYRHRGNSFINIFGLGTALLCCIIIFLFSRNELTYDQHFSNHEQIYRLTFEEINRANARHFATVSPPMGPAMVENYPDIEQAVRFRFTDSNILRHGDRQFYEYQVAYADSTLLTIFDFPLAAGNPATALSEENSIILTREMARKYFGNENPVGQTLELDNREILTVTGVFEPIPSNTHLHFDAIISFDTFEVPPGYPVTLDSWGWVSFYTYVLLSDQADTYQLERQFRDLLVTHMGEEVGGNRIVHLQPLRDVYLSPDLRNAGVDLRVGNAGYIYGMSAVALFLLLIACFNYMNLSTAQLMRRAGEVGVRKTMGAGKFNLLGQFLTESILLSLISVTLALMVASPLLELLSSWLDVHLTLDLQDYFIIVPLFLLSGAAVGTAAGLYPSLVITRYEPARALKKEPEDRSSYSLRKVLVVLQFSIAILLIAGSMVIREQIQFMQQKELGFNEDQMLVVQMDGRELNRRYSTIKNQLLQNPDVVQVSMGGGLLDGRNGNVPIVPSGVDGSEGYPMNIYGVHYDYLEMMDIEMVQGRTFSESFATDSANGIVLNRSAARAFGWEDPIGQELEVGDIMSGRVIGVTEDFHFASLHREIQPLVMFIPPTNMEQLFIRIAGNGTGDVLQSLGETWQSIVPDFPFSYVFLNEHLSQLYQTDERFLRLITLLTILTVLIACMGLYGLINYFIQQRTKEIGIRKILGASFRQLIWMISRRFLVLVVTANIIAWPVIWFLMDRWLQNFAYRTDVGIGLYVAAGLAVLTVALAAIGYRTGRAAMANPVESLRSE